MGVDIAAAEDQADLAVAEPVGIGEQGGEPGRAGALGDGLFGLDQHRDRAFDRPFGHQQYVVDDPVDDAGGDHARRLDRDSLRQRVAGAGQAWRANLAYMLG